MPALKWDDLPDSQLFENRFVQQILDWFQGRSFRPITVVRDGITLLSIGATGGVALSPDGAANATNWFVFSKMCVYFNDIAGNVPPNWTILTAGKDRFVWSANADTDIGATGGSLQHFHHHQHSDAIHSHPINNDGGTTDDANNTRNNMLNGGSITVAPVNHGHTWPHNHGGSTQSQAVGGVTGFDDTQADHTPSYWRGYLIQRT